MPPSLDDSSFIIVDDAFERDDDGSLSLEEQSSNAEQVNNSNGRDMGGTLILPSASTPETFTPPSSVDSDLPSLDFQHKALLIPDEDDDMEGIDDPLDLFSNVDALPSKFAYEEHEEEPVARETWKTILQDSVLTHRRNILFFLLPILVAILATAYTKHLDTLRSLKMANEKLEMEHKLRIMQLQQEIEVLKKKQQHTLFTSSIFADMPLSWFNSPSKTDTSSIIEKWSVLTNKANKAVNYVRNWRNSTEARVGASSVTDMWNQFKNKGKTTVDQLQATVEKDLTRAKQWWTERQRFVVEALKEEYSGSHDEETSLDDHIGTEATESTKGKSLIFSKKNIVYSVAGISVAAIMLGAAIDSWFGNAGSRVADYETFDPFGVPLVDFVE